MNDENLTDSAWTIQNRRATRNSEMASPGGIFEAMTPDRENAGHVRELEQPRTVWFWIRLVLWIQLVIGSAVGFHAFKEWLFAPVMVAMVAAGVEWLVIGRPSGEELRWRYRCRHIGKYLTHEQRWSGYGLAQRFLENRTLAAEGVAVSAEDKGAGMVAFVFDGGKEGGRETVTLQYRFESGAWQVEGK